MGQALLQSERNATLWIDLLRSYVAAGKFPLHDFVIARPCASADHGLGR
jgi:hypothetical protein